MSTRLDTYFWSGIPPAKAPTPRMREPSTRSKNPEPSSEAIGSNNFGELLIVRVQHDHEIGAVLERHPIAGFLVPAIALVAVVPDCEDIVLARNADRVIGAAVVDQDDVVDNVLRDFPQRPLERARLTCLQF